jgi:hypothetical protein
MVWGTFDVRVLWSTFLGGPKQKLNLISPKENAEQTQESYLVNNVSPGNVFTIDWLNEKCLQR